MDFEQIIFIIGGLIWYFYSAQQKEKKKAQERKRNQQKPRNEPFDGKKSNEPSFDFDEPLEESYPSRTPRSFEKEEEVPSKYSISDVSEEKYQQSLKSSHRVLLEDLDDEISDNTAAAETRFNLRQAIINDAILNRPYSD